MRNSRTLSSLPTSLLCKSCKEFASKTLGGGVFTDDDDDDEIPSSRSAGCDVGRRQNGLSWVNEFSCET